MAIISGGMALAGTVLTTLFANSKTLYRISQLETKVEKHNNMIERLYIAEGQIKLLEEKQHDFESDLTEVKHTMVKGVI